MGGKAFSEHDPPLPTPRMPKEIFTLVLSQSLASLRQQFSIAESPIEAPGKPDYGDVDILVTSPLTPAVDESTSSKREVAAHLQRALNAKAFVCVKNDPTINLAIPWPRTASLEASEDRYVQLDVHICPSPEILRWELFHSAHGDLWNILGTTIRPFGLTVNGAGMFIRLPEIELLDRKKAMIFLTSNPSLILEFLGLKEDKWWEEFESQQAMFEYAAQCRMFRVKSSSELTAGEVEGEVVGSVEGHTGGEDGKKKLKSNDRKRMKERPIFAAWMEEFIPACRAKDLYTNCTVTRDIITEESLEKFGVRAEYKARLKEWNIAQNTDLVWRESIKSSIPIEGLDPQIRAAAIRVLKAVVMEGEVFDNQPRAKEIEKNEEGLFDLDGVKRWVKENWERAGEIGWVATQEKMRDGYKLNNEKKRKKEEEAVKAMEAKKSADGRLASDWSDL